MREGSQGQAKRSPWNRTRKTASCDQMRGNMGFGRIPDPAAYERNELHLDAPLTRHPVGMREGSQGQAKRSPWNRTRKKRVLKGRQITTAWSIARDLAALQGARLR